MRYILLLLPLLGCKPCDYGFITMVCPKHDNICRVGDKSFPTLQECEQFVREASKFQPEVGRICVKADRPAGFY